MKNKKDILIAVLTTFCLTATLFMILPTRSGELGVYDPWIDNNEDGTVDLFDAIGLAGVYGTSGDPTKNVNVTNFPLDAEGNIKASVPRTLTRCVKCADYTVLEISHVTETNNQEHGDFIYPASGICVEGFFCFNPEGTLLNVTRIGIAIVVPHFDANPLRMDVTINNGTAKCYPSSIGYGGTYVHQYCIENSTLAEYTVQGLDKVTISNTEMQQGDPAFWGLYHIECYKVTVFVEYECLV